MSLESCSFKHVFSTDLAVWTAVRVCQLVSSCKSSGLVFTRIEHPSASCYIRDTRYFFFLWGEYVVIFATAGVCMTCRCCHFLYAAICLPAVVIFNPSWVVTATSTFTFSLVAGVFKRCCMTESNAQCAVNWCLLGMAPGRSGHKGKMQTFLYLKELAFGNSFSSITVTKNIFFTRKMQ